MAQDKTLAELERVEVQLEELMSKLEALKSSKAEEELQAEFDNENVKLNKDTIIASTVRDAEGNGAEFEWRCNANTSQIIQHVISTLDAASQTFEDDSGAQMKLGLKVAMFMKDEIDKY